jgi:hypothetical protein
LHGLFSLSSLSPSHFWGSLGFLQSEERGLRAQSTKKSGRGRVSGEQVSEHGSNLGRHESAQV